MIEKLSLFSDELLSAWQKLFQNLVSYLAVYCLYTQLPLF